MNAYTLAALPPALLLIAKPELWVWALAIAALVALAAIGAAAHRFRDQRDEARAELERRDREVVGSNGTRLRIVGQRTGAHEALPVADGFFPVHDRVEDDELTALMRATEERR